MIALQRAANIRDSWTVNGSQCHWHWLDARDRQWRGCQVFSDCLNPDLPTLFWFVEKFQDSSRPYSKVAVWNLREGGSTEVLITHQRCYKGSNIHCFQPIQRNVIYCGCYEEPNFSDVSTLTMEHRHSTGRYHPDGFVVSAQLFGFIDIANNTLNIPPCEVNSMGSHSTVATDERLKHRFHP